MVVQLITHAVAQPLFRERSCNRDGSKFLRVESNTVLRTPTEQSDMHLEHRNVMIVSVFSSSEYWEELTDPLRIEKRV